MKSSPSEFQPTILVVCSDQNDVERLLLSGAFQQTAKRIKLICAVPRDSRPEHIQRINELYNNCPVTEIEVQEKSDIITGLIDLHKPLMAAIGFGAHLEISSNIIAACNRLGTFSIVIQTANTGSVFAKARPLKMMPNMGVLLDKKAQSFAKKRLGLIERNSFVLGDHDQTDYSSELDNLIGRIFEKHALKLRRKKAESRTSISHHQGADRVLASYAEVELDAVNVEGYWVHGWHPPYYAQHPLMIALHKKDGVLPADLVGQLPHERENEWQFVTRQDQADYLIQNGYTKVKAIGLPFAYLPPAKEERKQGSLLVMPPHGRKRHFEDDPLAESYAEKIVSMRDQFSEICLSLPESDYVRGEWRHSFEKRGIPILIGNNPFTKDPLFSTKRLFSMFEYVTTNGFGSHIVYAAACGAKVSVCGPFSDWDIEQVKLINAWKLDPSLDQLLQKANSTGELLHHYPFLDCAPVEATLQEDWAMQQIGADQCLSAQAVREMFLTSPEKNEKCTPKADQYAKRKRKNFGKYLNQLKGRFIRP